MNAVKTVFLLVLLSGIFVVVGYLLAGMPGVIMAGVVALAMLLGARYELRKEERGSTA